jgi:Peptidase M10 serralysin C terminal/RTX calcium-binding nonapeptide repeat (4 copies)
MEFEARARFNMHSASAFENNGDALEDARIQGLETSHHHVAADDRATTDGIASDFTVHHAANHHATELQDSGSALATRQPLDSVTALTMPATFAGVNSNMPVNGAVLSQSAAEAEITFLSGVTSTSMVAAISFGTWNDNSPATYSATTSFADKWGPSAIGTGGGTVKYYFDATSNWTTVEKNAFIAAMGIWSSEVNIQFAEQQTAAGANFTITRGFDGSAYWTGSGFGTAVGGSTLGAFASGNKLSVDTSVLGFGPVDGSFTTFGGYPLGTIVHELGHALGLGHGGAYNGAVIPSTEQFGAYDTLQYSIMSYIAPNDTTAKYYGSYAVPGTNWGTSLTTYNGTTYITDNTPTTPMMLDILAAQRIYGAATTGPLASGGQIFGFNSNITGAAASFFDFTKNTPGIATIWDGGTNNTLDLSGWSQNATVDLHAGAFSSAGGHVNNIAIAVGTVINTYIGGAGNDTIVGNDYTNTLKGGTGNDTITAGNGGAYLDGGTGSDTLTGGSGVDTLWSSYGADGAADTLNGGGGNDTYIVYEISDVVAETDAVPATGGYDLVYTGASFTLGANVEYLYAFGGATITALTGNALDNAISAIQYYGGSGMTITGGDGADTVYGSYYADTILGGNGADTLWGSWGADNAADAMSGGAGADTYVVQEALDTVIETDATAAGGLDLIYSAISYTLGANVEYLQIYGNATIGTGNALGNLIAASYSGVNTQLFGLGGADQLVGGAGNDRLDGGAGADVLIGAAGNDMFVFVAGEANGDAITDFNGNGAAAGDSLELSGYGAGATFTNIDATHWQVNYGAGLNSHDIITFTNAAAINAQDVLFV